MEFDASLKSPLKFVQQKCDEELYAFKRQKPTLFWNQCVRFVEEDINYPQLNVKINLSRYGGKLFHGQQSRVQYSNHDEARYLKANINTRKLFYNSLLMVETMSVIDFTAWLGRLHKSMQYRKVDGLVKRQLFTERHASIVKKNVLPIAEVYGDSYNSIGGGPIFKGIPPMMLPRDEIENGKIVHFYPDPEKCSDVYLRLALAVLKDLLASHYANKEEYVYKVAYFLQLLVNLHRFLAVNFSLYMNMANGLLELIGIDGIPHGLIDYVALRLQPESFQRYFYDQTKKSALKSPTI